MTTKSYLISNQAILNKARDYIDGLMLSDGCVMRTNKTGYYKQVCEHDEWLKVISYNLNNHKIKNIIRTRTGGFKKNKLYYNLVTSSYIEFKEMHDRWYKKDYNVDEYPIIRWHWDKEKEEWFAWKKIIPKDICLNPECVANEYLGDGSKAKRNNHIRLATNGFSRDDTIFLSELLSETLDINCWVSGSGVINITNNKGITTFLEYIKDYKTNCYLYKFHEVIK